VTAAQPAAIARRTWLIGTAALLAALVGVAAWLALRSVASAPAGAFVTQPGEDAVQAAIAVGKPVVAGFGSVSCASCREMKPILAKLARTHGDRLSVVDIDVLKERQYLARYRIQLMPTQVFFDAQGREIGRHMGKITGDEILARLREVSR
jgi:thioredoxin 1